MRLATIRINGGTSAVRIDEAGAVALPYPDLRALLDSGDGWQQRAADVDGPGLEVYERDFAPPIPDPEKIVCVGLNYREHAEEAGQPLPQHPILFAKYSRSLVGAYDPIDVSEVSEKVDWEVELGVVIGREARHIGPGQARDVIAGYTIVNDISMRDWQFRTPQFLQGKTFESSTPVGPYLVTADEVDQPGDLALSCTVNGETMQSSTTAQLIFSIEELVAYLSTIITLAPGDLIATGTPSGVGVARKPPVFLRTDDTVSCTVEGLGEQRNRCVQRDAVAVLAGSMS